MVTAGGEAATLFTKGRQNPCSIFFFFLVSAGGEAVTLFAEGRPSSCSAPPGSPEGAGTPAPAAAFPSAQSGRGTLTWVVVVPFHDADVHGGGRLRHRRSLPLRRVALHAAPLHRLQEPKAAAGSACGAGTPPSRAAPTPFPQPLPSPPGHAAKTKHG